MGTPSPLIAILKDELLVQRVFLSSDEERALDREADAPDDGDLAFERVKARRYLFYAALRDRFVYDGRPIDQWLDWIAEAEERVGGVPTIVTALATRVIEWSIRATDRKSMAMGFCAGTTRWLGIALLTLALWAWSRDIGPATWVLAGVGGAAWVGARQIARATETHVRQLVCATRARHSSTVRA
jgi:AcrR family transcriptional regulator